MASGVPLTVEVGAGTGWRDITADVHAPSGLRCSRGRTGEGDSSQAGAVTLAVKGYAEVDLYAGGGTPAGWGSPWWGHPPGPGDVGGDPVLTIGSRLRVSAGGRVIWTGRVADTSEAFDGGVRPLLRIVGEDAVARAARTMLDALHLWWARHPRFSAAFAWQVPLDDPSGSPPRIVLGGDPTASLIEVERPSSLTPGHTGWAGESSVSLGSERGPGAGDAPCAVFTGATERGGAVLDADDPHGLLPTVGGAEQTVALWVRVDEADREQTILSLLSWSPVGYPLLEVIVTADGRPGVRMEHAGGLGTHSRTAPTARLGRGRWHHLAIRLGGGAGQSFLRDIVLDGSPVTTAPGELSYNSGYGARRARIGGSLYSPAAGRPQCLNGAVAGLTVWDERLSDAALADLARGTDGWAGETTAERAHRIAAVATTGPTSGRMGAQATAGRSAATALDEVARVEGTYWGTRADGALTLGAASDRYDAQRVAAERIDLTMADIDPGTVWETGSRGLATRVTVTRPGAAGVTAVNAAAETALGGPVPLSVALPVDSEAAARTRAEHLLRQRSIPRRRTSALVVPVTTCADPATEVAVTGADLGATLVVTDPPPLWRATPTGHVVGITDVFTTAGHRRTFSIVPVEPRSLTTGSWVLGRSRLGVDTYPAP